MPDSFVTIMMNARENTNRDCLKYKSDEDVKCLSQILTQVLKNAIFDVFVVGMDSDKVKKDYLRKIEIIKSGAVAINN